MPRQCIFVGTTNQDEYLRDETGNRRLLPVRTGRIDIEALARDRDQLWAEAVRLYEDGAKWWLVDPDVQRAAQAEQRQRLMTDPWEPRVAAFVEGRASVSIDEVLGAFDISVGRRTRTRFCCKSRQGAACE